MCVCVSSWDQRGGRGLWGREGKPSPPLPWNKVGSERWRKCFLKCQQRETKKGRKKERKDGTEEVRKVGRKERRGKGNKEVRKDGRKEMKEGRR